MKNLLLLLVLAGLVSCGSGDTKQDEEGTAKKDKVKLTPFLDSIGMKLPISLDQIRHYTHIDSIYFTGVYSNAKFTGDSAFRLPSGYYGGIVEYSDERSCVYKFLLVFNPTGMENTDLQVIYTECDHDPSANYVSDDYVWTSDTTFRTIESTLPANSPEDAVPIRKISSWKITHDGLIDFVETVREGE